MAELPPPVREWLDQALAQPVPPLVIREIDLKDPSVPDFLKRGMAFAQAATLNGYKILYAQGKLPTAENLAHELTHVAMSSIERAAPELVAEATERAARIGAELVDAAFSREWRTKAGPENDEDHRAWWGARYVRGMAGSVKRYLKAGQSDVTGALELDLMIPPSDVGRLATRLGRTMPGASDQWYVLATYAGLNRRYKTTVSSQYRDEEFVTYLAGTDRDYAARLFSRLKAPVALAEQLAAFCAEWDEAKHPRGKTSGASTPGSFAPGGIAFAPVDAERFVALRDVTTRPWALSPLAAGDLAGHRLFATADGKVGFALSADGDLRNLFNNGGPPMAGRDALVAAIEQGVRTLDCWDDYLPDLYTQAGFVETGRMRFDPAQAPPGWDVARRGTPDVVFMAWKGWPDGDREATLARLKGPNGAWRDRARSGRYYDDWTDAKLDARRAARP